MSNLIAYNLTTSGDTFSVTVSILPKQPKANPIERTVFVGVTHNHESYREAQRLVNCANALLKVHDRLQNIEQSFLEAIEGVKEEVKEETKPVKE